MCLCDESDANSVKERNKVRWQVGLQQRCPNLLKVNKELLDAYITLARSVLVVLESPDEPVNEFLECVVFILRLRSCVFVH